MSRRRILLLTVAALVATPAIGAAEPTKPNILWLIAEDFGNHLSCCGTKEVSTPNLDRLAQGNPLGPAPRAPPPAPPAFLPAEQFSGATPQVQRPEPGRPGEG